MFEGDPVDRSTQPGTPFSVLNLSSHSPIYVTDTSYNFNILELNPYFISLCILASEISIKAIKFHRAFTQVPAQ